MVDVTGHLHCCQTQCSGKCALRMSYKVDLRKTIFSLFGKLNTKQILNAFTNESVSRATVYRIIKDCHDGKEPKIKQKTGRPCSIDSKTTKKLVSNAVNKVGQSTRRLARKFDVSHMTVHRTLYIEEKQRSKVQTTTCSKIYRRST